MRATMLDTAVRALGSSPPLLLFFVVLLYGRGEAPTAADVTTPTNLQMLAVQCSEIDGAVSPGESIHDAVRCAEVGETITLMSGTHYLRTDVLIEGKVGLTIQGQGQGVTRVHLDTAVAIGFEIRSGTKGLTIRDLTIHGYKTSSQTPENPHGIASYSGQQGIEDVVITRVEVDSVAVGISVGSPPDHKDSTECTAGSYSDVVVSDNFVHDIFGTGYVPGSVAPASGYGIHAQCADGLTIRYNQIERVARHSIYVAKNTLPTSQIGVIGNVVVDHRHGIELPPHELNWYGAALAVARSGNVHVVDNLIVGSHSSSLEVSEENDSKCKEVYLIGNKFLVSTVQAERTGYHDIVYNVLPGTPVHRWGNFRNGSLTPVVPRVAGGRGRDPGEPAGWPSTSAIEEKDGVLYVMNRGVLHRIGEPLYGTHPDAWDSGVAQVTWSTMGWSGFQAMDLMDGDLYVMRNHRLYRVFPQPGNGEWDYRYSQTDWSVGDGFQAMTATAGYVYVIQNGVLHRVTPGSSNSNWRYATRGISSNSGYAMYADLRDMYFVRHWDYISKYGNLSNLQNIH